MATSPPPTPRSSSRPDPLHLGVRPGPVTAPVRAAVAAGSLLPAPGLGPDLPDLADVRLRAQLAEVLRTDHHVELYPGTPDRVHAQVLDALAGPGRQVLVIGVGPRSADLARRYRGSGAEVVELVAEPGTPLTAELLGRTLAGHPRIDLVVVVATDPVTGQQVALEALLAGRPEAGPVTVLDASIGLGAVPLETDRWGIDLVLASVDAGLESLPGLVPVCWSPRALELRASREGPVDGPVPHVQGSVDVRRALGALPVALGRVLEEGLPRRWARHAEVGALFQDHLQDRDARLVVPTAVDRTPVLTVAAWPDGVGAASLAARLVEEHGLRVDAGDDELGAGTWRIGLYGPAATHATVDRLLDAVDELLEG